MFKIEEKKETTEYALHSKNDTVIDTSVSIEGNFKGEGDITIEGRLTGSVRTRAFLKIGPKAFVKADIKAKNAIIAGTVHGKVLVEENLDILETAAIEGDITTKKISIQAGAVVNGLLIMQPQGEPARQDVKKSDLQQKKARSLGISNIQN